MKPLLRSNLIAVSLIGIPISFLTSFTNGKPKIIGTKMPEITGLTINKLKIDSSYFKNKVTLITFFYIACSPCMNEIEALKKLKTNKDFQVLYIAPHTAWQMKQFNGDHRNMYSDIRNYYKSGKIDFEILPECEKEAIRYPGEKKNAIKPECARISSLFTVFGYPATFIIDKKRIVREAYYGFSTENGDTTGLQTYQKAIDRLLKQH
ncbi:MAG: redoxin domain-containing protein [Bacteroidia bacterium]|nr:redoxin domain-containing protein [Bacteroidia bacterium]